MRERSHRADSLDEFLSLENRAREWDDPSRFPPSNSHHDYDEGNQNRLGYEYDDGGQNTMDEVSFPTHGELGVIEETSRHDTNDEVSSVPEDFEDQIYYDGSNYNYGVDNTSQQLSNDGLPSFEEYPSHNTLRNSDFVPIQNSTFRSSGLPRDTAPGASRPTDRNAVSVRPTFDSSTPEASPHAGTVNLMDGVDPAVVAAAAAAAGSEEFSYLRQLQKNYDDLVAKYALAEVTIDQLRLGARVNLYSDLPPAQPRQMVPISPVRHQSQFEIPQPHRAVISGDPQHQRGASAVQ